MGCSFLFLFFLQATPTISQRPKTASIPYKTTGMKGLYEPWYCGTVGNKIDPSRKLFNRAGSFIVVQEAF